MADPVSDEKSSLQSLLDQVAGTGGDKSSWPVALVLIGLFVLILSILGVKLALTKRSAAETARKLREQLEIERQARENEKLAANEAARQDAQEVIKDVEARVTGLKAEMEGRRIEHQEYMAELANVSSWDQITVVDAREPHA